MTPRYNHNVQHRCSPASVYSATDIDPPASTLPITVPDHLLSPNVSTGDNHGSRAPVCAIRGMDYSAEQAPRSSCQTPHKRRPEKRDTAAAQISQIQLGPKITPKSPPRNNPVLHQPFCGDRTTGSGKATHGPLRSTWV